MPPKSAKRYNPYGGKPSTRVLKYPKLQVFKSVSAKAIRQQTQERNYVDLASAAYVNDSTGSITLLNTVAQGASNSQRIGKKWTMRSIQMRGAVIAGTTGVLAQFTNILVYDKRPTGALPAITDILVSSNSNSFNNDNNVGRFRIIRRWDGLIQGGQVLATNPVTEGSSQDFDYFVKLNLPVVNKAAGTGVIADIEEGALYLVTVGSAAPGTTAPNTGCGFRIRYTEQ